MPSTELQQVLGFVGQVRGVEFRLPGSVGTALHRAWVGCPSACHSIDAQGAPGVWEHGARGPGLTWDGSFWDLGLFPSSSSLMLLSWWSVRDTRTGREKGMVRGLCDPEPLSPQISCTGGATNPRSISEDPREARARAIVCHRLYPSNKLQMQPHPLLQTFLGLPVMRPR